MRRAWDCVNALRPENGALGDSRMMLEQRQLARGTRLLPGFRLYDREARP